MLIASLVVVTVVNNNRLRGSDYELQCTSNSIDITNLVYEWKQECMKQKYNNFHDIQSLLLITAPSSTCKFSSSDNCSGILQKLIMHCICVMIRRKCCMDTIKGCEYH